MAHPFDIHVGKRLRHIREYNKQTQSDVGKSVGVAMQQIQKYEAGHNRISASRLYQIAQHFGVSIAYFERNYEQ